MDWAKSYATAHGGVVEMETLVVYLTNQLKQAVGSLKGRKALRDRVMKAWTRSTLKSAKSNRGKGAA